MKRHLRPTSKALRFAREVFLRTFGLEIFRAQSKSGPLKIIIGASGTHQRGWFSTEENWLNLLKPAHWERLFRPNSLDAILAEHVWEHLTKEEALIAAQTCFRHLRSGGYLRVAVPDGLHPNSRYIEWVKVNGCGRGADDHKVLYTFKSLSQLFESVGFKVNLLEYFDEKGEFHEADWNPEDGRVMRSLRFDSRNQDGIPVYTSIILDAIRQ